MRPILLASLALLSACTAYPNLIRHPAPAGAPLRALVVLDQDWNDPVGLVDGEGRLLLVRAALDTLGKVHGVRFSPDGALVMIESNGEGHPHLAVYRTADLVNLRDEERIPALGTLDPYPEAFEPLRWVEGGWIEFGSPLDFGAFNRDTRKGRETAAGAPWRLWRWDPATDRIVPPGP